MKIQNGFTLIEVMIVLAIIGILAAVAIPLFRNGSAPIGARDFSGLTKFEKRSEGAPTPTKFRCQDGFMIDVQDGQLVIKDGVAVRC